MWMYCLIKEKPSGRFKRFCWDPHLAQGCARSSVPVSKASSLLSFNSCVCKTQISVSPFQCLPTEVLKHVSKHSTFPAPCFQGHLWLFSSTIPTDLHWSRSPRTLTLPVPLLCCRTFNRTHQAGRTPSFGYKHLVISNSTEGAEKRPDVAVQKACVKCLSSCRSWSVLTDRDTSLILQLEATEKAAIKKQKVLRKSRTNSMSFNEEEHFKALVSLLSHSFHFSLLTGRHTYKHAHTHTDPACAEVTRSVPRLEDTVTTGCTLWWLQQAECSWELCTSAIPFCFCPVSFTQNNEDPKTSENAVPKSRLGRWSGNGIVFLQLLLDSHVLNMGSGVHPTTEHSTVLGVIQTILSSFTPCVW